jgi:GNAT superfamily N-acetyltransferase
MLRRARAEDAAKLSLLGGASFLESFAHDHPGDALVAHIADRHSIAQYGAWLADPDWAVWIIEEALGAPVGYALLGPPELPGRADGDLELKRVYVLHRWHGTGLGGALFHAVEEEAKARGATRLILAVYTANTAAQGFYTRQGFTQIGRTTFMVGDVPFEDLVVAKALR